VEEWKKKLTADLGDGKTASIDQLFYGSKYQSLPPSASEGNRTTWDQKNLEWGRKVMKGYLPYQDKKGKMVDLFTAADDVPETTTKLRPTGSGAH
jgi:hypothetical protein